VKTVDNLVLYTSILLREKFLYVIEKVKYVN
jgi:hypothetical protein